MERLILDTISEEPAGPRLNSWVADKVMKLCNVRAGKKSADGSPSPGWEYVYSVFVGNGHGKFWTEAQPVPPYSTSISAAFAMEEEITKMDAHIQVGYVSRLYELLNIPFNKPMPLSTEESLKLIRATPEQRCRAALKAVMGVY